MAKWKKVILGISIFVFATSLLLITWADRSPLDDQSYYKESKKTIAAITTDFSDTSWVKAAWAMENITPSFPVKVVGFGKNDFSEGVLDSLYLRLLVFEQGSKKYLYISYDLMIVHPALVASLEARCKAEHLDFEGVFYSATHTHNAIGSYGGKTWGDYFALGERDEKVIDLICSQTIKATKNAINNLSRVSYQYQKIPSHHFVSNRLDKENGRIDSNIRILCLKNETQGAAAITTFSAHATALARDFNQISGDYPAYYNQSVSLFKGFGFSVFSAGAVGSHEPYLSDFDSLHTKEFGVNLSWVTLEGLDASHFEPLRSIHFYSYTLGLRSPHYKIGKYLRVRPSLFEWAMGEGKGRMNFLQIADVCFVGTPCDFSGELVLDIEKELSAQDLKPIITSFNGEYIGYITPDKYYDWDTHEVRDANWFGPYNGRYFKESIVETLRKIKPR